MVLPVFPPIQFLFMKFRNKQKKGVWELYHQWKLFIFHLCLETPFVSSQGVYGIISEPIKIVEVISAVSLGDLCASFHLILPG